MDWLNCFWLLYKKKKSKVTLIIKFLSDSESYKIESVHPSIRPSIFPGVFLECMLIVMQ